MSTVLTTTSLTRPTGSSAGDLYYETDTNKIILYDGTTWREYYSDVETSIEETINITYDSIENILAGSNYKLGDMFAADPTTASGQIKFIDTPVHNTYYYITDATGLYITYLGRTNSFSADAHFDWDASNFGTSNWSGSMNFKNAIEHENNHLSSLTCSISGDNNEYLNISYTSPGSIQEGFMYTQRSESFVQTFCGGNSQKLLLYADTNTFVELSNFSTY